MSAPEGTWVKVEFWGLLPEGAEIKGQDWQELAVVVNATGKAFGFSVVQGLTAVADDGVSQRAAQFVPTGGDDARIWDSCPPRAARAGAAFTANREPS